MKIVITDGFTLNAGDLSWAPIAACGDLEIYERTAPSQLIERCEDADIILSNKVVIGKDAMEKCARLKLISVLATGYNVIDTKAAVDKKIVVCNVPGYGIASVAQHSFALLLELTNRVGQHAVSVKNGDWQRSPDWCYTLSPVTELAGKTLGVIGLGNIGQQVARIGKALNMQVIYHSRHDKKSEWADYVDMKTVFSQSDVVTLHCPLTPDNQGFVNKDLLRLMKTSAVLINTARGPLINEQDLADALNHDKIAGAALDVLSVEPPSPVNPLLSAKNCIITPHNAWMSKEARMRIINITADNIKSFLNGAPVNRVN